MVFVAHQAFREERDVFVLLHGRCAVAVFERGGRLAEEGCRARAVHESRRERNTPEIGPRAVNVAGASGYGARALRVHAWLWG